MRYNKLQYGSYDPIIKGGFWLKRIFAWAGILAIAAVFLLLIYLTVTGAAPNVIMAVLFCLFVIPVMIYAFQLAFKFISRNKDEEDK